MANAPGNPAYSMMCGINIRPYHVKPYGKGTAVDQGTMSVLSAYRATRMYINIQTLSFAQGQIDVGDNQYYDAEYKPISDALAATVKNVDGTPGQQMHELGGITNWQYATYPADKRVEFQNNWPVSYNANKTVASSWHDYRDIFVYYVVNVCKPRAAYAVAEVLNEPDNPYFPYVSKDSNGNRIFHGYQPALTPLEYATCLSVVLPAAKAAAPEVKLSLGGIFSDSGWMSQVLSHLANLLPNYQSCFDIYSVHKYCTLNGAGCSPYDDGTTAWLQAHMNVNVQHGNKEFQVDEMGWDRQTAAANSNYDASDADIAKWSKYYRDICVSLGISRAKQYEIYDDPYDNTTQYNASGVVNSDKTPRPVHSELVAYNASLSNPQPPIPSGTGFNYYKRKYAGAL